MFENKKLVTFKKKTIIQCQMEKQYFPNNGNGCLNSAFANLLVELGDTATAKKVYTQYKSHPLVSDNGGTSLRITTRLIAELTEEKYEGILFQNPPPNLEQVIRENYPRKAEELLQIFREEKLAGRIQNFRLKMRYKMPVIYIVAFSPEGGHAVVKLPNGKYINNGHIVDNCPHFVCYT